MLHRIVEQMLPEQSSEITQSVSKRILSYVGSQNFEGQDLPFSEWANAHLTSQFRHIQSRFPQGDEKEEQDQKRMQHLPATNALDKRAIFEMYGICICQFDFGPSATTCYCKQARK